MAPLLTLRSLWRMGGLVTLLSACGLSTLTLYDENAPGAPAADIDPLESPPPGPPAGEVARDEEDRRPPPPPGPGTDSFGVAMLYPTKVGGEVWTLAKDPLSDARFNPQVSLTRNKDGSWKVRSTQVRMEVLTSTGYDDDNLSTLEQEVLASRGYMLAPNDWKNVEMTGYVRLNAASVGSENFSWYARGGRHKPDRPCEGSAYKGALHFDGRVRWQKESWHVSYVHSTLANGTSTLKGHWVGFKVIMRNVLVGERTAVRLESWIDDDDDPRTWRAVYALTDDGGWGGDASQCAGAQDAMPISWGGPLAVFRWDGASDVDFKWLSVREIQ